MPRPTSLWIETAYPDQFEPLTGDATVDVCVIGAGLAGLTTAYLLAREGRSVLVIDDGWPGCGQTALTTAHLSYVIDRRYAELVRLRGRDGAGLAYNSHRAAIERIETIARLEAIDCDFERVSGYLVLAQGHGVREIDEELEAARLAGVVAQRLSETPVHGFHGGACLHFPRQAQFHPLKYLNGLAAAFIRLGGRLQTGTRAVSVTGGKSAVVATEDGRTITAGASVIATNAPFNDGLPIHAKQAPYRTYVIAARVAPGTVTHALYWDTADPYHYVRLQRLTNRQLGGDSDEAAEMLIVGGEDHQAGQAQDATHRFASLETWMRENFSAAREVEFQWSGQVMETHDGLAFIGRNPMDAANIYVATGDSGMGMTHGTIAGILLTDLIAGRSNPWTDLYDPSRLQAPNS